MRAAEHFPFVHDGQLIGALDVQDAGDFEPLPHMLETCRKAASHVWPLVRQYTEAQVPWTLTIRLGGEEEARLMNREFRHKDYATNVLSFPNDDLGEALEEGEVEDEWYVGDMFICIPVVQAEAQRDGKNVDDHLAHMVVHGMLHLVGYDHEDEAMAKLMEPLETEILATMGIADPYAENAA